jgi:hypothetical protein
MRAAALTPNAWASRTTVVTVGDFVPRSMAEIIDDEIPLRAANARNSGNSPQFVSVADAGMTLLHSTGGSADTSQPPVS